MGTFGPVEIAAPRARLDGAEGKTTEWKSSALHAYPAAERRPDRVAADQPDYVLLLDIWFGDRDDGIAAPWR